MYLKTLFLILVKTLKELLTSIQIGHIEKMKNVATAVEVFGLTKEWMTQGDSRGRTPLHLASAYGYLNAVQAIFKEIIDRNKDLYLKKQFINVKDYKGRTPLYHAAAKGHRDIVRFLGERKADLEVSTNEHHVEPGTTALMVCAEKNDPEGFGLLLEKRANILTVREDGADATYIAARYGHFDVMVNILGTTKIHSVINRKTFRGRTPLITAALHGHMEVCKLLFEKGANLDCQDNDKFTALMYAADQGHYYIVKWLLENGANVDIKNIFGKTASICAEDNGLEKTAYLLHRYNRRRKVNSTKDKKSASSKNDEKISVKRRVSIKGIKRNVKTQTNLTLIL